MCVQIFRIRVALQFTHLKVQGFLSQLCELRRKATDISQGYARTLLLDFLFSELVYFSSASSHCLNGQVSRLISTVLNEQFKSELLMYFFNSTLGVFSHVYLSKETNC